MDTKKIVEDSGKPEIRPFFMPSIIPSIYEEKVQPHKHGDEIKEAPETAWKFISPEMMPMPGTPDSDVTTQSLSTPDRRPPTSAR